jgi:transposase-like protein
MTLDINLTDAKFHNENAAREWFEASRWPNGVSCVHCGGARVARMGGKSGRPGLFHCPDCRGQFTVRTGHVMESSHVPLTKWALAFHLMASSKKGVSAKQIERTLDVAYNTAWFMMHRIREAMTDTDPRPLGGEGKVVEADEAYHGKVEIPIPSASRKGRPFLKRETAKQKRPIAVLVERRGEARAEHVKHVTGDNIGDFLKRNADTKSRLHTDESRLYSAIGAEFATHERVHHAMASTPVGT